MKRRNKDKVIYSQEWHGEEILVVPWLDSALSLEGRGSIAGQGTRSHKLCRQKKNDILTQIINKKIKD